MRYLVCCWFLHFLGLFIVQASQLTCPFNKIRVLDTEDVIDYHVDEGYEDLLNLISRSYADFSSNYFRSGTIPNKGNITLSRNFLFTGFTTKGIRGTKPIEEFYASQFTIEIITNSSTARSSDRPSINKTFTVRTADELYFPLYPVVPSHGFRFTVTDFIATSPSLSYYFWKLRLFGCEERNAIIIESNGQNVLCSSTHCPVVTTTTTVTSIDSPTSTFNASMEGCLVSSPSAGTTQSASNIGVIAGAIVVPVVLFIAVLSLSLILVLAWVYRSKVSDRSNSERFQNNVLKEVRNLPLYTQPENITSPIEHNSNTSSSAVITSSGVTAAPISTSNEYSTIEPLPHSTSNPSSTVPLSTHTYENP